MSMNKIISRMIKPGFHNRLIASLFLVFSFYLLPLIAEETNFPGVYRYKLDNNLELFVAENSSAPLASIHIAARTGAIHQTADNAGLFHLYEHMLFKGNEKYENQLACTEATNKMGAIDSNAYTSVDIVNYYFTIPSSQIENGLKFWSYAVRTPKFDEKELKNEISVVLSEIKANETNPSNIRFYAMMKEFFPEHFWKIHAGGNPAVVENAVQSQMKEIQKNYYVPENSAIFVGGDVHHEEVFALVKQIFGDWKNNDSSVLKVVPPSKTPFSKIEKRVFVHPGSSDSIIQAGYYLRGPDGETDSEDTYAADVWTSLANTPDGKYVKVFTEEKSLGIPDSDYIGGGYQTRRASGLIYISCAFVNKNEDQLNPVEKSELFLSTIQKKLIPLMTDKEKFFEDDSLKKVLRQLENRRIYELESASAILGSLTDFWSGCGSDYFFSYDENLGKVTEEQVADFVKKYIEGKNGMLLVTVSPEIWKKYGDSFRKNGFEELKLN